jgi:D-specific alpha-keto acid dehydrogenase
MGGPLHRARRYGITVYGCEDHEADLFEEMGPRLGVTPTIISDAVSANSIMTGIGNRCVSVGHKTGIGERELRALKDAGAEQISTRSIGVDHINVEAAEALGIAVENVVYAPDGVADFTVMLILMVVRDAREVLRAADRHDFRLGRVPGRDLREMTVGVVGVGNIGTAVITRLQGFGCRVLAYDKGRTATAAADFVSLDALLQQSDIVTLHVPLNARTRHVIGREELAAMKPGACLVNTGRGALVDTEALLEALEHGKLGGAALDVLEGEEGIFYFDRSTTRVDNPSLARLQQLPNAIVTPHTAYYTSATLQETIENTLTQCVNYERNRASEDAQDRDLVRGLRGGA